jgi:hypothetical protein
MSHQSLIADLMKRTSPEVGLFKRRKLMSTILRIYRAKPNPPGKERQRGPVESEILLGEWVDIENVGTESITFSNIKLHHTKFNSLCQTRGGTECYWNAEGRGLLKPAQILRVHTGKQCEKAQLAPVDDGDTDWHAYAERDNFVLNNRCGDIIVITWVDEQGRSFKDAASYAPNPRAGAILVRLDNQLIPAEE